MKKLLEIFNYNLNLIKPFINKIYSKTKELYIKQKDKSLTSFTELNYIFPELKPYEDDFQNVIKIDKYDDLILDIDGLSLYYNIEEVKFKKYLYDKTTYPMIMLNGKVIPGSVFSEIFNDGIGFWGYQSKDIVNASFTLDFDKQEIINKIILKTNNNLNVKLFIKKDENSDWSEIGERSGINHVWNIKPTKSISLKFEAKTNLFVVSNVKVGLAKYNKFGQFKSKPILIEDLYKLKLIVDADVPFNTFIDFFIEYDNKIFPLKDEIILTGSVIWNKEIGNTITLPPNTILESIKTRFGYNTWDIIDTYDWEWINIKENPDPSGIIEFDENYKLLKNSVRNVFKGETTFVLGQDYNLSYDIENRKIKIENFPHGRIKSEDITNIDCSLIIRKKSPVKQIRSYVNLEFDDVIKVWGFETTHIQQGGKIKIRHVVKQYEKLKDQTIEINYSNFDNFFTIYNNKYLYIVQGLKGLNLIEIEFWKESEGGYYLPNNINNEIKILNYNYFAKNQYMIEVPDNPNEIEYSIESIYPSGYQLNTPSSGVLMVEYAIPNEISRNEVCLIANFISVDGNNTPTLRYYKLENFKK